MNVGRVFSILAPIIRGKTCNYPGIVNCQTRLAIEIQVFYPVYGVCTLLNLVDGDSTSILPYLGLRTITAVVQCLFIYRP